MGERQEDEPSEGCRKLLQEVKDLAPEQPPRGILISYIVKNLVAVHASEDGDTLTTTCRAAVSAAGPAFTSLLGDTLEKRADIDKRLSDANAFYLSKVSAYSKLEVLNAYLASNSVLVGNGTTITIADIATFIVVHDVVAGLAAGEQETLPNLFRWVDYIQNKEDVNQVFDRIPVKKAKFAPPNNSTAGPTEPAKSSVEVTSKKAPLESVSKTAVEATKPENAVVPAASTTQKKVSSQKPVHVAEVDRQLVKAPQDSKKGKQEKEKKEKPPAQKKEVDSGVSILNIRVGVIKKAWKHPNADALYVEEIDVGEGKLRQVVSGLAKFLTLEEMQDRRVLVLTNVKPGNVRDVLSAGLVLCASNEDHSVVEPVTPPAAAPIGERVIVEGHEGSPEEVLNPKKKQFEKIQPDLRTDAAGVACYQGLPLTTSAGACTSKIVNGTVK